MKQKWITFVDNYFLCGMNATEAYMRTYKPKKRTTAGANGHELLKNTEIQEEIQRRLEEKQMGADEALNLLADIARGDLGEFVNDFGMIDTSQLRKEGKTKLIKRWKTKTITINGKQEDKEIHTEDIELYAADAAIRDILKMHGRYRENVDITSGGKELDWKSFVNGNTDSGSE